MAWYEHLFGVLAILAILAMLPTFILIAHSWFDSPEAGYEGDESEW